ncbi:MAG: hypothetical protein H0V95_12355 [Actinobacteria bacterium]|nr:hypothetical protein [Actinomycetota bacterium]
MRRASTLTTTALLTLGLATAAFAGVAAAGELSKKEYKAEINDVCVSANEDLGVVFEEVFADLEEDEEPSPEQQQAAADDALPIFRQMLDDIEDLDGPKALKKKVDKLVDGYRDVADEIEDDPEIVFSADAEDPFVKLDKQAAKLGLDDCVQSG